MTDKTALEVVAWQWFTSGHLRKFKPKDAEEYCWNPLVTLTSAQAAVAAKQYNVDTWYERFVESEKRITALEAALGVAREALGKAHRQVVHANVAPHGCIKEAITLIDTNPSLALNDLISWHVRVALDPKVSSDAQALVERGADDMRERCAVAAEGHYGDGFRLASEIRSLK